MFGIDEVNYHVLLHSDTKTLKNSYFLNKTFYRILNNGRFWRDKFCYDQSPILDNHPSFQEHIKILNCKDNAEKILLLNTIECNSEVKKYTDGHIVITFNNDIKTLTKLLPENEEKFQSFLKDQTNFEIYIIMKPVYNCKDCDIVCLTIFRDYPDINCRSFARNYSFTEILFLLTKALYYRCIIKDGIEDSSNEFLCENVVNGNKNYFHRREILSELNFTDKEILQFYLNKLKNYIDKK